MQNNYYAYARYCNERTQYFSSAFKRDANGNWLQLINGQWQPEVKPMETPRLPRVNPDGRKI